MSGGLFFASILVPGFGYLRQGRPGAFAYVFATVVLTYGLYAILLGSVSTLTRSYSAWHIMAVLGAALHIATALHGAGSQSARVSSAPARSSERGAGRPGGASRKGQKKSRKGSAK